MAISEIENKYRMLTTFNSTTQCIYLLKEFGKTTMDVYTALVTLAYLAFVLEKHTHTLLI